MIPCDQNREALAAHIDGELSPEQVTAIHQHIRTCPDCAAEIAELIQLKRSLRPARARYTPNLAFRQKMQKQLQNPFPDSFVLIFRWRSLSPPSCSSPSAGPSIPCA